MSAPRKAPKSSLKLLLFALAGTWASAALTVRRRDPRRPRLSRRLPLPAAAGGGKASPTPSPCPTCTVAARGSAEERVGRNVFRFLRVAHADAPADADSDADADPAGQPALRRSDADPADTDSHAHHSARHSVQGPGHFRVPRRPDRVARRGRPHHQRPRGRHRGRPFHHPEDQPRVRRLRVHRPPARDHPTHSGPAPVRRGMEGFHMTTIRNGRASRRFPRRQGVAAALVLALAASGCVSSRAYREGEREEQRKHWDIAVLAYEKAISITPRDSAARIALQRARFQAAQAHFERGRLHRSAGQLDLAVSELEMSLALDPTNDSAQQELRRAKADVEARAREIAGGTPVEQAKAKSTRHARGAPDAEPLLDEAHRRRVLDGYGASRRSTRRSGPRRASTSSTTPSSRTTSSRSTSAG